MTAPVRVLVVDDSALMRKLIPQILANDSSIQVVGTAMDGVFGLKKIEELRPQVITLDLEMPEMDGFTFLRWLMANRPTPVIIVSSYADSKTVFKALEFGAAEFIAKPPRISSPEYQTMVRDLLNKVKAMKSLRLDRLSRNLEMVGEKPQKKKPASGVNFNVEAVGIGSSTGGPSALKIILNKLPADFPAGVAISQHMPKGFTASFAERLNKSSMIRIKEARDGDEFEPGKALLCPGGSHMFFRRSGEKVITVLRERKTTDKYVPSVDIMMASLAEVYGSMAMGIVLTGMGNDGATGMLDIKKAGGYTIVESEETAVVFGMPSEVIKAGAAGRVLPVSEIPDEIIRLIKPVG